MYFDFHTHNPVDLAQPGVYNLEALAPPSKGCSIGVHPWWIDAFDTKQLLEWVKHNLENTDIKAIGECGLDKAIPTSLALQLDIFHQHVQWANGSGKPLILHCVRAHQEILKALEIRKVQVPVIFHGFRGSWPLAEQIIKKGFLLGIGAWCRTPQAKSLIEMLPIECIMPESDVGPTTIEEVYREIAFIKNMALSDLKQAKQAQALSIFGPQTSTK